MTVSHGVADSTAEIMGIPRSRFHVIYNPVVGPELFAKAREPLDHPWFGSNQPPVVLAVGNLSPWKDFGLLLKAFSLVREEYFRPLDVQLLVGDATKAEKVLGWKPTIRFDRLVDMMVDHDLSVVKGCESCL